MAGYSKEIALRPDEHASIRMRLQHELRLRRAFHLESDIEEREVRDPPVWEKFLSTIFLPQLRLLPVTALFLLLVSGISLAAGYAVPGDSLYPVKLLLNEELLGAFRLTAEAKTRWDVERTERRLKEAMTLVATDAFEAEKTAALSQAFLDQVRRARTSVEKLAAEGQGQSALEVLATLEVMLKAHSAVLSDLATIGEDTENPLSAFIHDIDMEAEAIAASHQQIEEHLAGGNDASRMIQSAGEKVQNYLESVRSSIVIVPIEETSGALWLDQGRVHAKLEAAEANMHDAKARLQAGENREALSLARNSLQAAEEASLIVEMEEALQAHGRSRNLTPYQLNWKPESRRSLRERTETSLERQELLNAEGVLEQ
ncbi:MAG TPA: hypothetical protein VJB60_02540 [Candidatus Peribacterales bacterium]|nr:hypothetical protein [Candidatus Peribacterales bacterium]